MALLGIAVLETAVDLAGLNKGLKEAEGSAKSGGGGIAGSLSTALGGLATVGVTAGAAAAAAVGAIGVAAFNVAGDVKSASNNMQAELGLTADEAARMGDIAAGVWANNFGDNIAGAAAVVSEVRTQLGAMSDNELTKATEKAFMLSDTFGTDYPESLNTVKALTENFGITTDQAFDLITTGMQDGLNSSGDFLDSISEYSGVFADSGFSADQMYSIMETGNAAGVLGTDKISDAVKEMGIRLNEGGEGARAAFDTIGLSFDDIAAEVSSGQATWGDYFGEIVTGINGIEDPMARQQAQVEIFGTAAEDMGTSFTTGLSDATVALEDMAGSTDGLAVQYDSLGATFEGFKREALLALEPLGDILLELANSVMPLVQVGFEWFKTTLVPMIAEAAKVIGDFLADFKAGLDAGMTPLDAFKKALEKFIPPEMITAVNFVIDLLANVLSNAFENVKLAVAAVSAIFRGDFAGAFENLGQIAQNTITLIVDTFGELAGMIGPALADMWTAFTTWFGEQDWQQLGIDTANAVIDGLVKFVEFVGPILADWFVAFTDWVISVDWIALATDILTAIAGGLEAFGEFVGGVFITWGTVFTTWVTTYDWAALAQSIIDGIVGGLTTAGEAIKTKMVELATSAWTAVKKYFGIESPSRLMYSLGVDLMLGWAMGIEDAAGAPAQAMSDAITDVDIKTTRRFADMVASIIAIVGPTIAAFRTLLNYNIPNSVLDNVEKWAFQVKWLVRVIAVMAWDLHGSLDQAQKLARTAADINRALIESMEAFTALADFKAPAAGVGANLDVMQRFIKDIAQRFMGMATIMSKAMYAAIEVFAEAISSVLALIVPAIQNIRDLSAVDFGPIIQGMHLADQIKIFRNITRTLVRSFAEAASEINDHLGGAITAFADAARAVYGIVIDGLSAAAELAAVDFGPILQGDRLAGQIRTFRNITRTFVRLFAEAAAELDPGMADSVVAFAEAARSVIDLVADGIKAAIDLMAAPSFKKVDLGTKEGLAVKIRSFRDFIAVMVTEFSTAAAEINGELSTKVIEFSDAAASVIGLVIPGIEAITALMAYVSDAGLADSAAHFAADLIAALDAIVTAFEESALYAGDALVAAADMAGSTIEILAVVQPGIDAITALAEYISDSDAPAAAAAFAKDLAAVVAELVDGLTKAADDISDKALKKAIQFATDVAELASTIADALNTLEEIAGADLPDISDAASYLIETAELLADTLTASHAAISGTVLQAAAAFARNVGIIVDDILQALEHLKRLMTADVPGGLQALLSAMVSAIASKAPQAGQAASLVANSVANAFTSINWQSIGQSIGSGIVAGINASTPAIQNAARSAALAAYNAAMSALQASSPSKLFAEVGQTIPEGIALGVMQRSGAAEAAIMGLAADLAGIPGAGNSTTNYYQFELQGGGGLTFEQQLDMMIDAALQRRGIRADHMARI